MFFAWQIFIDSTISNVLIFGKVSGQQITHVLPQSNAKNHQLAEMIQFDNCFQLKMNTGVDPGPVENFGMTQESDAMVPGCRVVSSWSSSRRINSQPLDVSLMMIHDCHGTNNLELVNVSCHTPPAVCLTSFLEQFARYKKYWWQLDRKNEHPQNILQKKTFSFQNIFLQ